MAGRVFGIPCRLVCHSVKKCADSLEKIKESAFLFVVNKKKNIDMFKKYFSVAYYTLTENILFAILSLYNLFVK